MIESASLPVYVLIGGESRRFGSDKATHLVDGTPLALDVGQRLAADGPLAFVGPPEPPAPLKGYRCIADAEPQVGPLSGAVAAIADRLKQHGPGLFILASCDLVRPERAWLDPLHAAHQSAANLEVAAYHTRKRWQPFPSVVSTAWLEPLRAMIESGTSSFQAALKAPRSRSVPWPHDGDGPPQANTPEELAKLLRG